MVINSTLGDELDAKGHENIKDEIKILIWDSECSQL